MVEDGKLEIKQMRIYNVETEVLDEEIKYKQLIQE